MRYTKFQRRYPVDFEFLATADAIDANLSASVRRTIDTYGDKSSERAEAGRPLSAHRQQLDKARALRHQLDDPNDHSIHTHAEYLESRRQQACGVRAYKNLQAEGIRSWLPSSGVALSQLLDEGEAAIVAWEREHSAVAPQLDRGKLSAPASTQGKLVE